jgi:hypothetical protein
VTQTEGDQPTGPSNPEAPEAKHILTAIRAVMATVRGIAKAGEMRAGTAVNARVQYRFQKYDDMAEAIGTAFRDHGVMTQGTITEISYHNWDKKNKDGGTTMWTSCRLRKAFSFTSLVDGSHVTIEAAGEGSDSSDKATNKAETAAYKTAIKQAFTLSTADDSDPDETRPQVQGENVQVRNATTRQQNPWVAVEQAAAQSPMGEAGDDRRIELATKAVEALSRCRTTGDALKLTQWAMEAGVLNVSIGGASVAARIITTRGTLPQGSPTPVAHQTEPPQQSVPDYQPSERELAGAVRDLPRADVPPDEGY